MTKKKGIISKLTVAIMAAAMIFTSATSVKAAVQDTGKIYLRQATSSTCTLASAAMMFRNKAYLDDSENYARVTEASMKSNKNWSGGLVNSLKFTDSAYGLSMKGSATCYYSMAKNGYKLNSASGAAGVKSKLKGQLDAHPEGIVLYLYNNPSKGKTKWQHAVLLTRYSGDTFYCLNPGTGNKSEVDLVGTFKKKSGATTIDGLLSNAVKIWYVTSANNTCKRYYIGYELNGAANNAGNPTEYTASSSFNLNNPYREGYTFTGWHKNSNSGEVISSITAGTTGDMTLFAGWTPIVNTPVATTDPDGNVTVEVITPVEPQPEEIVDITPVDITPANPAPAVEEPAPAAEEPSPQPEQPRYEEPKQAESTLTVSVANPPKVFKCPGTFNLKGYVTSNYDITRVTAWITDSNGNVVVNEATATPYSKELNIQSSAVNKDLSFIKIKKAGSYTLYVTATDASGKTVTQSYQFTAKKI